MKFVLPMLVLLSLAACQRGMPPVAFHADGRPPKLSDWHVVEVHEGKLELNQGVVPYDLNTPLFTDYAHKLRTIWMPKGSSAKYEPVDTLDFPVGTVISKTFYYPRAADGKFGDVVRNDDYSRDFAGQGLDLAHVHLIETRILVHRKDGWAAIPYVWNDAQTEATLARTGAVLPLTLVTTTAEAGVPAREDFNYVVPDESQCASCHAQDWIDRKVHPIGPKARHINKDYLYADGEHNQLEHLAEVGYLSGLPALDKVARDANWADPKAPLDARARAYLDINCGHCHNPNGAANTTGLSLIYGTAEDHHLGICKPPTAAGQGTGDHFFDIVPGKPDDSIIPFRLSSTEPGTMMPEIGRSTMHHEGVALIKAWIAALPGTCVVLH
ncbi:SO2930 family diheme c-type cytochrome [Rhodanobacter sp. B05]|uniref:SO2930 family diheme c-type cytochrome n=1 Tax=Rhodanobacter sp. B05 TaxID=1945859 RepID=UPI0020C4D698|nr:SO2930 family diheme c-type cytochrome [Rhodanobacter sp. B05]